MSFKSGAWWLTKYALIMGGIAFFANKCVEDVESRAHEHMLLKEALRRGAIPEVQKNTSQESNSVPASAKSGVSQEALNSQNVDDGLVPVSYAEVDMPAYKGVEEAVPMSTLFPADSGAVHSGNSYSSNAYSVSSDKTPAQKFREYQRRFRQNSRNF